MAELTQRQLEELDQGKPNPASATFYEKAALDVLKSKEAGHRVYTRTVYVLMKQPGVTDAISFKATPEVIAEYPEEYQQFLNNRQGARKTIPINVIPTLQMEHMQELLDMGITTTEQIVKADILPAHLEYVREPAQTFQSVLEESSNGNSQEEVREEEVRVEAEDVHAVDRQEHQDAVGRPEFPRSLGRPADPVAGGHSPGGQEHSRPEVDGEVDIDAMVEKLVQQKLAKLLGEPETLPEVEEPEKDKMTRGKIVDDWKVDMVWRP